MPDNDLISRAAAIDAIVSVTAFPGAEYIKNLCQNPANSEDWLGGVCDAINAVEDVNAVDAAPIVRCKNCKHYLPDYMNTINGNVVVYRCELDHDYGRDDYFCADGERANAPTCGPDYCEIGGET